MTKTRKSVFISYAHKDRKWADELYTSLAPWIRDKRVNLWDDSQIEVGSNWRTAINTAIRDASVAVLLVSKQFIASDFIMNEELPRIIKRAKNRELRIIWIAIGHSAYDMTPLVKFQAANDPSKPLDGLKTSDRDKKLTSIAKTIGDALTVSNLAYGLDVIDDTTEPLEAVIEGRPEAEDRDFGIEAIYVPSADQIKFTGTNTTITADDIKNLPDDDHEYIADLEEGLTKHYGKWRRVKRKLGDVGGVHDDEISSELLRIARLMCRDLNSILDFLKDIHKAELEDHYGRYRHICSQL